MNIEITRLRRLVPTKKVIHRFFTAAFLVLWLAASVRAENATVTQTAGNTITYLGKVYDQAHDQSHFKYRVTRPLLSLPLHLLRFLFPDCPTSRSLISVTSATNAAVLPTILSDLNAFDLTGGSLLDLSTDLDLTLLGDVGEGLINIEAKALLNGATSYGTIAGPKVDADVNIGIGGINGCVQPTATPTPTRTATANPTTTTTPVHTATPTATPTIASHPTCLLDGISPITVAVGDVLNLNVQLNDAASGPLTVNYTDTLIGAILSVPNGGTVNPGHLLNITWTPDASNAGTTHLLPLTISSNLLTSVICDIVIKVKDDLPPVIIIPPLPNPIPCQGLLTQIQLDASASYDPEGKPLTFAWGNTCNQSAFDNAASARPLLSLALPGQSVGQACFTTVTASDGVRTAQVTLPINVNACINTCAPANVDLCGVCNGNNACVDCAGTVNGAATVDQCGVCGGNNACLDCAGTPNGTAQKDSCGVCGGDETTCRTCDTVDLRSILAALDGAARNQSTIIIRPLAALKNTASAKKARVLIAQANNLYTESWRAVWGLKQNQQVCSNYVGCTSISSVGTLSTYLTNTGKAKKIALKAASLIEKSGLKGAKDRAAKLRKATRGKHFKVSELVNLYPKSTQNCG